VIQDVSGPGSDKLSRINHMWLSLVDKFDP